MLPETITLNYDPTGGETPADFVYDKKTHEENRAFYREHASLVSGSPLQDNVLLRIEEAKRTASSYGTVRHFVSMRSEEQIETPTGVQTIAPCVLKLESSSPAGYSVAGRRAVFERFKALISHAEFEDFFFENEC